ncbi:MAG: hypothetical protein PF440_01565 [Thiomicrorhabdus sp.]|jgi:hypothetical protein|nr:hypothetical protein [Thiomicrorhabdus sp.]
MTMKHISLLSFTSTLITATLLTGCNDANNVSSSSPTKDYSIAHPVTVNLLNRHIVNNDAAYIPAQCYTKTAGKDDKIHNPCFSCHTEGLAPNYINDSAFQMEYDFRTYSRTNRWSNLFKDRSVDVAKISDAEILNYVRTSNYINEKDEITLANRLAKVPEQWDVNQDGKWNGYTPDSYFNFDQEGFDVAPDQQDTGWRAFAYAPFFGTFWPTNGSTNDVIIRLPETMRQDDSGNYSRQIYKLNLAIVEAMITRKNIAISNTDEKRYQVDLNRNGVLDNSTAVIYNWAPTEGKQMSYVGMAKTLQQQNKLHLAAGLYPEGTEFLHSVRYIDQKENGGIQLADRLKELRYAKKTSWNKYSQLYNAAMGEEFESTQFPDRLRRVIGNSEEGVINGLGWTYQGFIEDQNGNLRPQSFEESMYCIGCHSGLGATTDSSFAFARKLGSEQHQAGWFHWTQRGLHGVPEPKFPDGSWQYTEYLLQNHSANEFRNNEEVIAKFFNADGSVKNAEIDILHNDIGHLLLPSPERALTLNKAYKVIVDEQSYIYGRDAHVKPVTTSWDIVPIDEKTGIKSPVIHN